jgi:hypothetical protein
MAFFASVYYIPQFKIAVKGLSAMSAGLELTPLILGVVVAAIFSGQAISRIPKLRKQFLCVAGGALITIGAGLLSTVSDETARSKDVGYQIIVGLGVGFIMQTTLLAGQSAVEHKDVATVTAMLNFFRISKCRVAYSYRCFNSSAFTNYYYFFLSCYSRWGIWCRHRWICFQ